MYLYIYKLCNDVLLEYIYKEKCYIFSELNGKKKIWMSLFLLQKISAHLYLSDREGACNKGTNWKRKHCCSNLTYAKKSE